MKTPMRFSEFLAEKDGIETWPVSNMVGRVKKFRKIDGWWEHPVEVKRWMKSHEIPRDREEVKREADLRRWGKADAAEERRMAREKKAAQPTDDEILAQAEDSLGHDITSGDPIDYLGPWLRAHDLDMGDVDRVMKKQYKKTFYQYVASVWDDIAADHLHDAKNGHYGEHYDHEWFARGNPWK